MQSPMPFSTRPVWRMLSLSLLLMAMMVVTIACSDDNPTTPTAPEPLPEPERITETFGGTVTQGGSSTHVFTVAVAGNIEMTLTSVQPLETLTLGVGIGTTADGTPESCAGFAQDNSVRQGATLLFEATTGGAYCVFVYDVGNIFPGVTVRYTLDVTHP